MGQPVDEEAENGDTLSLRFRDPVPLRAAGLHPMGGALLSHLRVSTRARRLLSRRRGANPRAPVAPQTPSERASRGIGVPPTWRGREGRSGAGWTTSRTFSPVA